MSLFSGSPARWITVIGVVLLVAACGGGDDDDDVEGTATPGATAAVATATPLAGAPEATIVTDAGPPVTPSDEVTYIVEAGDTLSAIAVRFDTSVVAIQNENDLTSVNIFVGQELVIPSGSGDAGGGDAPAGDGDSTGGDATGDANRSTYTVESGDFASTIAERFNITLDALATANEVSVDELNDLFVGQVLNIPPAN